MRIKRKIEGKEYEFELTSEELRNAYYEKEHFYDTEDVKNYISNMSKEEFKGYSIKAESEILDNEELLSKIAYRKRKYVDEVGMLWSEATREALRDVLREENENY
ncbi:MAG: hypothetical protein ACI4HM_05205 [Ruminococcus sp.]